MSDLVEVTYIDGSTEVVTVEEAVELRENGELADPVEDNQALTLDEFYGDGYPDS